MITKFLPIATFAVLTALTIGGSLSSVQAANTDTPEAKPGTAPGAKPGAPTPAAHPGPATTPPAPVPLPVPIKVDAKTAGKRDFTATESQAPLMSPDQRNALYFQWIGGFVLITGSIIGFIVYKARPPKPTGDMSLEQASDAYDGQKKEEATTSKVGDAINEKVEPAPGGSETTEPASTEPAESTADSRSTEPAVKSAEGAPGEAAGSSESDSKTEDKNTPATG